MFTTSLLVAQTTASAPVHLWPFAVLVFCVGLIIVLITVLRVHAFLALILAAFAAGLLTDVSRIRDPDILKTWNEPAKSHWVQAIELTATELGTTAGKIGVVIALASVISLCLMESGAADKVVRKFLRLFGEKRAGGAIVSSGYILSIPIFFDTFFMLLLPLARALRVRTGKDYLLYVMAICCGGTVTHSLCAPHPGPLTMAEYLKLDLGLTIMVGVVVGTIPTAVSWLAAKWLNRRLEIPLRETPGTPLADLQALVDKPENELPSFGLSILPVLLPIFLISLASTFLAIQGKTFDRGDLREPRLLVERMREGADPLSRHLRAQLSEASRLQLAQATTATPPDQFLVRSLLDDLNKAIKRGPLFEEARFEGVTLRDQTRRFLARSAQGENLTRLNRSLVEDTYAGIFMPSRGMDPVLFSWGEFLGNRNMALVIGACIALWILARQKRWTLAQIGEAIGPTLETAGVIILITSAGGAFGLMLKNAGVGEAIQAAVAGRDINLILLAWLVAAVIRVAQGSATVAMLTTASMMYPIMTATNLPYHPIYLFLAIGFGAMILSWMNDSGFWVVGKLSGFTERETLKSWTVIVTVNSLVGLALCLVLAGLLPFR